MSDKIIKVLDTLGDKFGIMIDWTQQNVQPYIQDLCQRVSQYKLSTSIVELVIWAVVFVVGVCGIIFAIKMLYNSCHHQKMYNQKMEDITFSLGILGLVVMPILVIVSLIVLVQVINDVYMCVYIPEKVLLDMISSI